MKRLRILTLLLIPLAYLVHSYKASIIEPSTFGYSEVIPDDWHKTSGPILSPEADKRMADQTFLTFPEWFLVYSPEEQARFFVSETSTDYPYQSQVNLFWDSYDIIGKANPTGGVWNTKFLNVYACSGVV